MNVPATSVVLPSPSSATTAGEGSISLDTNGFSGWLSEGDDAEAAQETGGLIVCSLFVRSVGYVDIRAVEMFVSRLQCWK
jgi:hypothetical protein